MKLYSYYRSSCSWRVRIVLNLKGLEYEVVPVNLLKGQQNSQPYAQKSPSALVPTLELDDGRSLGQSLAIINYLDTIYPDTHRLLPQHDSFLQSLVLQAALIIAADSQPLQNLRNLQRLFPDDEAAKQKYAQEVIERPLASFERVIQPGMYCFGDTITLADVVLVPHLFNARRFQVLLDESFPRLLTIERNLMAVKAFQDAAPERQIDFPKSS
jgi:maleylacetoacetate isomerase